MTVHPPKGHAPAPRRTPRTVLAIVAAAVVAVVAACAGPGSSGAAASGTAASGTAASGTGPASGAAAGSTSPSGSAAGTGGGAGGSGAANGTVTLITHDSFAVDKATLAAFEKSSGLKVQILAQGDAGAMVSKLILTKGNPLGDAVFGIDNTFASKALDAGILAPYTSPLAKGGADRFAIDPEHRLTPIDYGDVCVNVDHRYFAAHHLAEPVTFQDLTKPQYKNLMVTEDPATSSPGLAFLLGTIAHFGQNGWQQYWKQLKANGIKVDSGWTEAYSVDFSGSTGKGDRPIVVSYASSPPDEVRPGMTSAPTGALLDTCFRQVEFAGVLAGAKNPAGARKVVDFLLSKTFQSQVPTEMYVYPVDRSVTVPADWAKYAPVAKDPATLPAKEIGANRAAWIGQWSDLMQG